MSSAIPTALPVLKFIKDEAATEDKFGSHTRLAQTIASVIKSDANLKVIGLLGSWGSGKSTVIKLMEEQLKADDTTEPHCFSYDAWRHQNDPARRSFLETLVHYLELENLSTKAIRYEWKDKLDKLNGRVEEWESNVTPTLTTSGRLLVLSLFFIPFASQFVGIDWYEKTFKTGSPLIEQLAFPVACFLLALPLLLAVGIYICWRPLIWPTKKSFWSTHRGKYKGQSILSLVMNRETEKSRHRITRTPDPTAIEFQDIFRSIMAEVSQENRRFIFVIDNLDRLPETEAIEIWSTIRSFFLGAHETEHVRRFTNFPTVILPIDEDAVRRMYSVSHGLGADALAKSFMDKTFDLTFRVTRPILSDWHSYLEVQMKDVFDQNLGQDWAAIVGALYEDHISAVTGTNNLGVTPRAINTLVNSIGALWLQRHTDLIEFASIAYYTIRRETIDADIASAVATPYSRIDEMDSHWQRSVAALHYGVPPDDALQILIEPQIRRAIADYNETDFEVLRSVRGYEPVLLRALEHATRSDVTDPAFIFNAALILDHAQLPTDYSTKGYWRTLHKGLPKSGKWKTLDQTAVTALVILSSKTMMTKNFIDIVVEKLGGVDETAFSSAPFIQSFVTASDDIIKLAGANSLSIPRISVPGEPSNFLTVIAHTRDDLTLMKQFVTAASGAAVIQQLVTDLTDPIRSPKVESKVRALIARGDVTPWEPLLNAAKENVQNQSAKFTGMGASVACLGLLRSAEKSARAYIKQCASAGQLGARLSEAHMLPDRWSYLACAVCRCIQGMGCGKFV